MVYIINKKVGGSVYYYLVKNTRENGKFKKYKKYIGKKLPSEKKLAKLGMNIEKIAIAKNRKYKWLSVKQVHELDQLKKRFKQQYKEFDEFLRRKFEKEFIVRFTSESNAIEGNTMDLTDTKKVVVDEIAPAGKKLREIFEARNMEYAFKLIQKYRAGINKKFILRIHKIMMQNVMQKDVGKFRKRAIKITGSNFVPPNPEHIDVELDRFLEFYRFIKKKFHPLEVAALTHMKFSEVHPFIDGNGRVARLLMDYVLIKNGFPPVIIKKKDRQKYYDCLEAGHQERDYKSFVKLLYDTMIGEYG